MSSAIGTLDRQRTMTIVSAVVRLSLTHLLRSRRTLVFLLLGLLPPVLALLFAVLRRIPDLHIRASGFEFFSNTMGMFYLHFLLVLVSLFYGTALINSEVEDRTLTYLLVRPAPKRLLVLGKYITYLMAAFLILLPSVILTYLITEMADGFRGIFRHLPYLAWDCGVLFLGAMAYGALFVFLGTLLKRPVMFGLFFIVLWEWPITYVPGRFGKFTILHYLFSLFPHSTAQRGLQTLFGSMTSKPVAVLVLLLVAGAFLYLSMELFHRKEYVLEQ